MHRDGVKNKIEICKRNIHLVIVCDSFNGCVAVSSFFFWYCKIFGTFKPES